MSRKIPIGLQLSSKYINIKKVKDTYVIQVVLNEGKETKGILSENIHLQLSYTPDGEKKPVFLNAKSITNTEDDERVYNFVLETNFDINKENQLYINNFEMQYDQPYMYKLNLTTDFDLVYYINDPSMANYTTNLSYKDGIYLLKNINNLEEVKGISHESKIKGSALTGLWEGSRSLVTPIEYVLHEEDVVDKYTKDEYERNIYGSVIYTIDDEYVVTQDDIDKGHIGPVGAIVSKPVFTQKG